MVVDEWAFRFLEKGDTGYVGNWATFENIPNQNFARTKLAITEAFKKDVGYVVELEVVKPLNAQIGVVGSQGSAPGGANQLNFLFEKRGGAEYFTVIGTRKLP